MEREAIRVEPFSTYLERRPSLERVVKCNIYCTNASRFDEFNEVYARYFPPGRPRASSCAFRFFRGRSISRSTASR